MAVNWVWRARQLQRFAAQDPPHEYANCITKAHLRRAKLLAPDPTEMDPDEPMWPENWGQLPQSLPSFLTRGEWVSLPEYPVDGEEGEGEEEVPTPKEKASKDPKESGKKAVATIATKFTANSATKPEAQSAPQSTTQPMTQPTTQLTTKLKTQPPKQLSTKPKTRPTAQPSTERNGSNKPQAKHKEPGTSTRPQTRAEGQAQIQCHRQTVAQEPQYPLLPSLLPSILPYSPLLFPAPAAAFLPPPPPPPPTSAIPSTSSPLGLRVSGAWPEGEEGGEANFDAASSSRDQDKYLVIEEDQEQPPPDTRGFTWDEMKECLEYLKHERRKR
ncbi:hypothetical protein CaCOL14_013162 [Colletotrichum acutatum]